MQDQGELLSMVLMDGRKSMVSDLLESRLISPSLSSPPSLSLHTICISRLLFQLFRFFPSILLRTSHFLFSFPYSSFVFPLLSFLLLYFLLLFYILLFFLFLPLTPWVHSYSGLASLAAPSPSCVLTSFLPILQGLSEIKVEKIERIHHGSRSCKQEKYGVSCQYGK